MRNGNTKYHLLVKTHVFHDLLLLTVVNALHIIQTVTHTLTLQGTSSKNMQAFVAYNTFTYHRADCTIRT